MSVCARGAPVLEEPYLIGPNWDLCAKYLFALTTQRMRGEIKNNESHWYEIRARTDLKWEWIHRTHGHEIHTERDAAVRGCTYRVKYISD